MKFSETKVFHQMREQFEKDIKDMPVYTGVVKRETNREGVPADVFYTDGTVNALFTAYMFGFQYANAVLPITTVPHTGVL